MSPGGRPEETVLLIHGTFAGDESDEGAAWWQQGSETWKRLQALLPAGVTLGKAFHWGKGPNSQRSRREAGIELFERLQELERADRPYHLVGHSHGGSVIWACLRQSVLARAEKESSSEQKEHLGLPGLKSWTTVGTPFLQFEKSTLLGSNLLLARWSASLYRRMEKLMVERLPRKVFDILGWLAGLLPILVLIALVATVVAGFVVAADQGEADTVVVIAVLGFPLVLVSMLFMLGWLEYSLERFQFHREAFSDRAAMREFGSRWLGLYSKDDEAINGLKTTLKLQREFVPRRSVPKPVFRSERMMMASIPMRKLGNWLFNKSLAPLGDRFITSQLARGAQGNDRPGTAVSEVTTGPVPFEGGYPPIPEPIDARLVALADEQAREVVPELRGMLGKLASSEAQLLERGTMDTYADALIHTSYFADDDVLKMIAWHIARSRGEERPDIDLDGAYVQWMDESRSRIAEGVLPAMGE